MRVSRWLVVLCVLLAVSAPAAAEPGKVDYDVRYRYEGVDQQGFDEDAVASTIRLRLGYETEEFLGFTAYFDFEALRVLGGEQYNSTANGKTQYPTVADPEDEEVNQAYLAYSGPGKTVFKLGRQRFTLGNHRFVGNVGWRQLEQTFDAFSVKGEFSDDFSFTAAYLNNVNRIFGEHNPDPAKADTSLDAPLLDLAYKTDVGAISIYGHFLEFQEEPLTSHRNLGARFAGKHGVSSDLDLHYAAEYAEQSDYKDAPSTVDAGYRLAELGLGCDRVVGKVGYELLEGDGTYAFVTPLATLHKFNGWTDRFLSTPLEGLEDVYVSISANLSKYKLTGVYHDFSSDTGGLDYGTELGLQVARSYEHLSWSFKYANYDTDFETMGAPPAYGLDTEIFWFTLQLKN